MVGELLFYQLDKVLIYSEFRLNRRNGKRKSGGSIPACAGEPASIRRSLRACAVYPRVCGGTSLCSAWLYSIAGLSPRVRGNLTRSVLPSVCRRSIPACAGEPHYDPQEMVTLEVYPRVCGGTYDIVSWARDQKGLSPRVRGNPVTIWQNGRIPKVYPRVCGGTDTRRRNQKTLEGLSPRVRGNQPN